MIHYVCTGGCNGVSGSLGVCQNKNCIKHNLPLTVCHCDNGFHQEALEHPNNIIAEPKKPGDK